MRDGKEWTVKTGGATEERTVRGGWEGERVPLASSASD